MATTLLKVNKEKEMMKIMMTPKEIRNKLFYFHNAAHVYHQDTTGGWEHDTLGKLYEGLIEFKDDIPEKIMGYMGGKRIQGFEALPVSEYVGIDSSNKLAKEIIDFAKKLEEWAEEKEYCDISNIAQSLSGLGAKTVYRLTLK
jgi:hypothetical protein